MNRLFGVLIAAMVLPIGLTDSASACYCGAPDGPCVASRVALLMPNSAVP